MALRIATVGIGKIARDKHVPAIEESPDFDLVAGASLEGTLRGRPTYRSVADLLAGGHDIQAVAMCQPPQARFEAAQAAIAAGCHVLLEKPPGATVCEVDLLSGHARNHGVTLFASWHSRFAPAVDDARSWLASRRVRSVAVRWKEDVRRWHPGQAWIWEPGGLGVFDPGINALSIVTTILPLPFHLESGALAVPKNKAAPIAADLVFRDAGGAPIRMEFDWRQQGDEIWEIRVETDAGPLVLAQGGRTLFCAGEPQAVPDMAPYSAMYRHFGRLIAAGRQDVDTTPLRHVADAFLRARRITAAAFDE